MNIEKIKQQAINQTIQKVNEDINAFMEGSSSRPLLKEYMAERKLFLDNIWGITWLNKITTSTSLKDKQNYLLQKGINTEELGKKSIKKVFQAEIVHDAYFNLYDWLMKKYQDPSVWEEKYEVVQEKYRLKQEKKRWLDIQTEVEDFLHTWISDLLMSNRELIYIYIRYQLSKQLLIDITQKDKYKLIGKNWENSRLVKDGRFDIKEFKKMYEFLGQFTGDILQMDDWGRIYYDYEKYGDIYEQLVYQFLLQSFNKLFPESVQHAKKSYLNIINEQLHEEELFQKIGDELYEFANQIMDLLEQESIDGLLAYSKNEYDLENLTNLYHKQLEEQARREFQEEIEKKRKIAEEKRMMEEIFEREFQPVGGRSVQYILHIGETNTGKTYHALKSMKQAKSGCYLAPLRLLALEVYDTLNAEGIPCSLKTGEEDKINPEASHIACTVEMFYEKDQYECIVIDEAQMIADNERGFSWYKAITKSNANEVHIIASKNSKAMLLSLLQDSPIKVYEYEREIPLKVEKIPFKMQNAKKGDALICFSRRKVLENAAFLQQRGKRVSMIYGSMPPETRKAQIEKFNKGETSIIVSTDAIGMGLNLPIKRIVFLENDKFDGIKRRRLTSQEVKQIAGRAGRKGIYNIGSVAFTEDINKMKTLLEREDEPISTFTIAPTNEMFERFQKYSRDMEKFFQLWERFRNPKGTTKSNLQQEKQLYELVKGTEIEARLSLDQLYSFLHIPFASNDPGLTEQWLNCMKALVSGEELPEPNFKTEQLEDVEYAYKAIGLHLMFLYRLDKRTEAIYWERIRKELSDDVSRKLNRAVKKLKRSCKRCGKKLALDYPYPICEKCYLKRYF